MSSLHAVIRTAPPCPVDVKRKIMAWRGAGLLAGYKLPKTVNFLDELPWRPSKS